VSRDSEVEGFFRDHSVAHADSCADFCRMSAEAQIAVDQSGLEPLKRSGIVVEVELPAEVVVESCQRGCFQNKTIYGIPQGYFKGTPPGVTKFGEGPGSFPPLELLLSRWPRSLAQLDSADLRQQALGAAPEETLFDLAGDDCQREQGTKKHNEEPQTGENP